MVITSFCRPPFLIDFRSPDDDDDDDDVLIETLSRRCVHLSSFLQQIVNMSFQTRYLMHQ